VTSSSFIIIEYNLRLIIKELEFFSYLFEKEFCNLKFTSLWKNDIPREASLSSTIA